MLKRCKVISTLLAIVLAVSCMVLPVSATTLPFSDVPSNSWYRQGVEYVYNKGLMVGTSPSYFSPNQKMTRGMLVTVLYRMEGSPTPFIQSPFKDTSSFDYYYDAATWAYESSIVQGTSSRIFSPNFDVTREQMAAILYRYALHKGYNISNIDPLMKYKDREAISSYAKNAFGWAVNSGIIAGTSATTLSPKETATRAQVATILYRFNELINYDNFDTEENICKHRNRYSKLTKDSTCIEKGIMSEFCKDCGIHIEDRKLYSYGDCDLTNWSYSNNITPFNDGIRHRSCINCRKTEQEPYSLTMETNHIFAPGTEINTSMVIGSFTQSDVDKNDVVYSEENGSENPFVLGHNYGTLKALDQIKVGQKIYLSVNGKIRTYEVIVSEYGIQNSTRTDIIGQTSGYSVFHNFGCNTLHMYTCYGGLNGFGRWMVLATLVE